MGGAENLRAVARVRIAPGKRRSDLISRGRHLQQFMLRAAVAPPANAPAVVAMVCPVPPPNRLAIAPPMAAPVSVPPTQANSCCAGVVGAHAAEAATSAIAAEIMTKTFNLLSLRFAPRRRTHLIRPFTGKGNALRDLCQPPGLSTDVIGPIPCGAQVVWRAARLRYHRRFRSHFAG
jgi:hypothetical protein